MNPNKRPQVVQVQEINNIRDAKLIDVYEVQNRLINASADRQREASRVDREAVSKAERTVQQS